MPEPRVTVLMPVRDHHPVYLRRALGSILAQSSPDWELVVIDDGADWDGILDGVLPDERVRLVRSEPRGFAGALNTGLRHARTDFAAVLFGDDMWTPHAVAVFTAAVERHPDVDVFHGARRFIDERDRPISGVQPARERFALSDFVDGSPVKHPMCWRRERALAVGGMDEAMEPIGVDDYDFPWTMADAGARFLALPDCLYLFRDHRESFRLTTHVPRSVHVRALRRMMRKHGVPRERMERHIADAKRDHLRQCLYRSGVDRWLKTRLGHDPRAGWRETYR